MDKQGVLDPAVMCPRIPERANEQISVLAEMAVAAAHEAMKRADRAAADIDGVLVGASNLQRAYPAMAVEVQDALGIDGFGFDMNVACSSATFALQTAADMVAAGHARAILVCNPEICSGHLNFRDRDSHFIFGDVATAFIVERADTARGGGWEILSTKLKTKFSNNIRNNFGFLNRAAPDGAGKADKLFVQEGRKVFKDVVPMVSELILGHLAENEIAPASLKRIWLHQANQGMNDMIARRVLGREPLGGRGAEHPGRIRQHQLSRLGHRVPQIQPGPERGRSRIALLLRRGLFGGQRDPEEIRARLIALNASLPFPPTLSTRR